MHVPVCTVPDGPPICPRRNVLGVVAAHAEWDGGVDHPDAVLDEFRVVGLQAFDDAVHGSAEGEELAARPEQRKRLSVAVFERLYDLGPGAFE